MEHKLSDFITLFDLTKKLGISQSNVRMLIEKRMPYIMINEIERFHEPTVCKWLISKQTQVKQKGVEMEVKE